MFNKPCVLVVDDEELVATTTSMILSASGFDSNAAFSGPEALGIARARHIDMLLTDVMMAPMNGIELAISFLEIHPAAPVFLMSGTVESARLVLVPVSAEHAFKFLQKPVPPRDLIDQLRAAWAAIAERRGAA